MRIVCDTRQQLCNLISHYPSSPSLLIYSVLVYFLDNINLYFPPATDSFTLNREIVRIGIVVGGDAAAYDKNGKTICGRNTNQITTLKIDLESHISGAYGAG